jgi:uncharacterized protein (TIGR02996 family)
MSDEKDLLAAIWEHPHDDTVRLVYADWLQETGEPVNVARAEFIRLQCERARLDEWDDAGRIEQLNAREEQLWAVHRKAWRESLPKQLRNETFRRGFVYSRYRSFGGARFLKLQPNAFDAAPQWSITLDKFVRLFDKVFASPLLLRCDELCIHGGKYPQDVLEKLADNDRLRNVSNLHTSTNHRIPTPASVTAFFNGPASASVTKYFVWRLPPAGLTALAATRTAARLSDLTIIFNDLDLDYGTLFTADTFPRLRSLCLRYFHHAEPAPENALVRLVTATPDTQLRRLDLRYAEITDTGMEQLAAWPGLARLRWLNLDENRFREAGYLALARSPHLRELKYLAVHSYWLEKLPKVKAELDARFGTVIHYV